MKKLTKYALLLAAMALMMAAAVCLTGCQHNTPSDDPIYTGVNETVEQNNSASVKNCTGKTILLKDDTGIVIVENGCTEDLKTAEKVVTICFRYDKDTHQFRGKWTNFNVKTSIGLYIGADDEPYYLPI